MFRRRLLQGIEEFWRPPEFVDLVTSGRGWKVNELRKKSFDDLHRLWYVCLKEKNLLATEKLHCRSNRLEFANPDREILVRQTMARIKTVLRQRQINGQELPQLRSPTK